jgi:hypothetical protein
MQGPKPAYKPHKVAFHVASGVLVRVCEGCGASWKLGPTDLGSLQLGWRPILELDMFGHAIETVSIDVLYCPVDAPALQQAQQTSAPKKLCYCNDCRVKKQHYDGNENCFCVRCQGKHPHKGV